MKIAICDDNKNDVDTLQIQINKYFSSKKRPKPTIMCFANGDELLKSTVRFNIVFLDIMMPGSDGISISGELKSKIPDLLIFITTDYPEYLDDAMDVRVFRYFRKPIEQNRLNKGLDSAIELLKSKSSKITIQNQNESIIIPVSSIIMIKYSNGNSIIVTATWNYVIKTPLQSMYEKIKDEIYMYKTHRNYIVNLNYVFKYTHETIYLKTGNEISTAYLTKREYTNFNKAMMLFIDLTR